MTLFNFHDCLINSLPSPILTGKYILLGTAKDIVISQHNSYGETCISFSQIIKQRGTYQVNRTTALTGILQRRRLCAERTFFAFVKCPVQRNVIFIITSAFQLQVFPATQIPL